jgi:hypothetical protein
MLKYKSIVRNVVMKTVCNDSIVILKLQAEPVSILIVQVDMPKLEHEDVKVEDLYGVVKEILKEVGERCHKQHDNGRLKQCVWRLITSKHC